MFSLVRVAMVTVSLHSYKTLTKSVSKGLSSHFSEEDVQMANRSVKKCSKLLIARKAPIKTTAGYHRIPVTMVVRERQTCK